MFPVGGSRGSLVVVVDAFNKQLCDEVQRYLHI